VSLDSIQLFGSSDATVYLDTVFWDPTDLVFDPRTTGDFNSDGVVDAADYTVFRDNQGANGAANPADANGDAIVSPADYSVWAANYGASGLSIAIPEPAAWLMAVVASLLVVRRAGDGSRS
jgi:hypothetical protein